MSSKFRASFKFASKELLQYFPGHMAKGMRILQTKLKQVDCLIEVHDARVPLSGRNTNFRETLEIKPHILILNKADLVDQKLRTLTNSYLNAAGTKNVLWTCCTNQHDVALDKKLIPMIVNLIQNSDRYNRTEDFSYNLLVIGIPNVGKSSLINALRIRNTNLGNATKVGAIPGITRSVLEKIRICESPKMFLFDSPGILLPRVVDQESTMKLALCGCLQDPMVGEEYIADYMLYFLNRHEYFKYVNVFGLKEPTDDILYLLLHICKQYNLILRKRAPGSTNLTTVPNIMAAAQHVLKQFRTGKLGKVTLDIDELKQTELTSEAENG